jgi:hypothetical protein
MIYLQNLVKLAYGTSNFVLQHEMSQLKCQIFWRKIPVYSFHVASRQRNHEELQSTYGYHKRQPGWATCFKMRLPDHESCGTLWHTAGCILYQAEELSDDMSTSCSKNPTYKVVNLSRTALIFCESQRIITSPTTFLSNHISTTTKCTLAPSRPWSDLPIYLISLRLRVNSLQMIS